MSSSRLIECLAATEAVSVIFSDTSVLQAMLDFEVALARAEASVGIIPAEAAVAIAAAGVAEDFDFAELQRQAWRAGTPAIPLVRMLTANTAAAGAGYVHWGATSQDVADTAMILLLRQIRPVFESNHQRLEAALTSLSDAHAGTVMCGRTLLQPAPPIPFGLKAAGWMASLQRSWIRVTTSFEEALILQFGGASGTLASLGNQGLAVSEALGRELDLRCPEAPWHTHRDRLGALMAALSVYTASVGKMALDIALLMQAEVSEAAEPCGDGRGGSSTMPHKRNPTACMLAIAAARRTPGLLANFLNGMLQEHERAVGGWQSEWETIRGIVQSTGAALESMVEVCEGLRIDAARMRANIPPTVFAEKAMMQLAVELGRGAAHRAVETAIRETGAPPEMPGLTNAEDYLGSAETFRARLLKRGS